MMKKAIVPFYDEFDLTDSNAWSNLTPHTIDCINWKEYPFLPQVTCKLVHDGKTFFIQFVVAEKDDVRAMCTKDQDPVYQDSCVEFFIETDDAKYHNFEFNSAGVILSASGKGRTDRKPRTGTELASIRRIPSGIYLQDGLYRWSLVVGIPFAILGLVRQQNYKANLYKCGDLTSHKHYVSWSPIHTSKPDFHTPQYFGMLALE